MLCTSHFICCGECVTSLTWLALVIQNSISAHHSHIVQMDVMLSPWLCGSCMPNQKKLCICIIAPGSDTQSFPTLKAHSSRGGIWLTVIAYTFWLGDPHLHSGRLHKVSPCLCKSVQYALLENNTVIHHSRSLLSYGRPAAREGASQHISASIHQSIHSLNHWSICSCLPWTKQVTQGPAE